MGCEIVSVKENEQKPFRCIYCGYEFEENETQSCKKSEQEQMFTERRNKKPEEVNSS